MDTQNMSSSLLSAPQIFRNAWESYKKHWDLYLQIMVPATLSLLLYQVSEGSIIFIALYIFFMLYGQVTLMLSIKKRGERGEALALFRESWPLLLPFVSTFLLTMLVVILGFILLVIPGIIFSIWFSMALFVFISENKKGKEALKESKALVKGSWWKVFWRILFISIIIMLANVILSIILSMFGITKTYISDVLIGLFWVPIQMTYMFLLYENLKSMKKEKSVHVAAPAQEIPA